LVGGAIIVRNKMFGGLSGSKFVSAKLANTFRGLVSWEL
jgi:hypothetical protein